MVKITSNILAFASTSVLGQEPRTHTVVSFGNYNGTYEGDISDILPATLTGSKKRTGQSEMLGPDVRRYSHLKLMISYILGSGALAARYTSYGCHCLLGPDVVKTHSKVQSQDNIDEICRRQTMCLHCAKVDTEPDCDGGQKGYSFSGHVDSTGRRYIKCLNTPGTCRHTVCLCDKSLAEGFRDLADDWNKDLHHEWSNFNFKRKCAAAPSDEPLMTPASSVVQHQQVNQIPGEDIYQYEYQSDYEYDYPRTEVQNQVTTTTAAPEVVSAPGGIGGGNGGAPSFGPQADMMKDGDFESVASPTFITQQLVSGPRGPSTQCCGEYPERFPYRAGESKACCGSMTYNPKILQCCPGNEIRPIGMC